VPPPVCALADTRSLGAAAHSAGQAMARSIEACNRQRKFTMTKGQHGNKEAKKPKKVAAVAQLPASGTLVPVTPAAAPPRTKKR
jgi:hypothetical protein